MDVFWQFLKIEIFFFNVLRCFWPSYVTFHVFFLFRFGFCSAEKLLLPSMPAVGMCLGLSEWS